MTGLFVIDTNALILSYPEVFKNQEKRLSENSINIIRDTISNKSPDNRISIPSVVFIEIFRNFFRKEEFIKKFNYEIFKPIQQSDNIEIREIDKEVLEGTIKIGGVLANHEIHDKIIVASAIALGCPLITTDDIIQDFSDENPDLLSVIK